MKINCVECNYPVGLVLSTEDDPLFQVTEEVRQRALCRECSERRYAERQKALVVLVGTFTAISGIVVWLTPSGYNGWMLLNIALAVLFIGLSILPHELGHALAAKALGMKLFGVEIGVGKELFKFCWLGTDWRVKMVPTYGVVTAAYLPYYSPFRLFLMILAGPAVNALIILALLLIGPDLLSVSDGADSGILFGFDLIFANALVLLTSIIPYRTDSPQGRVASDGMKLISIIKSLSDPYEAERGYWYEVGSVEHRYGNYVEAARAYERVIEIDRYDPHAKLSLGSVQVLIGDYERARHIFLELLNWPKMSEEDRASILNQIAFTNVLIGDDELLEEADRFSEEALQFDPAEGLFYGTRGAVLVLQGDLDQGILHLHQALDRLVRPEDCGVDLLFIAHAHYMAGEIEEATAAIEEVAELNLDYPLLTSIAVMLEKRRQTSAPPVEMRTSATSSSSEADLLSQKT
ncbi:MAG: site-2 protease family protein [Candidatus Kapaibacterium sp.]